MDTGYPIQKKKVCAGAFATPNFAPGAIPSPVDKGKGMAAVSGAWFAKQTASCVFEMMDGHLLNTPQPGCARLISARIAVVPHAPWAVLFLWKKGRRCPRERGCRS
jgi:hypothetical protein